MNKKGFTLVELLAVIAMLAVLVIIAVPNVMRMFNTAKEDSFLTEAQNIFKVAQQAWIQDSVNATNPLVYSSNSKKLDLSGRTDINYYVRFNKAGDIVQFVVYDGTFQIIAGYDTSIVPIKIEDLGNSLSLAKFKIVKLQIGMCLPDILSSNEYVLGDIDRNGTIDKKDYVMLDEYTKDEREFNEKQLFVADVNGDGEVDEYDKIELQSYIINEPSTLDNKVAYKVEHYQQKMIDLGSNQEDVNYYKLVETDKAEGIGGKTAKPLIKKYEGFTSPSKKTVTISSDGSTVVKYFYKRNKYEIVVNMTECMYLSISNQVYNINGNSYPYSIYEECLVYTNINGHTYVNTGPETKRFNMYYDQEFELTFEKNVKLTVDGEVKGEGKNFSLKTKANNMTIKSEAPESHTITYDLKGGSLPSGQTNPTTYNINSSAITLVNPTKNYYTFAGWSGTGINGTSTEVTIPSGSTGNRTYTANYTPVEYTITYNLNDGTNNANNPASYNFESTPIVLGSPTRKGYTFVGWSGSNGTTPVADYAIPHGSTGNKTYTANWRITDYSITYNLDGGSLPSGTTNPTTYNISTSTFTLNNPTKTDYVFVGWTGSNGTEPKKNVSVPIGSTGDKSYKAMWIKEIVFKYTGKFKYCTGNNFSNCTELSNTMAGINSSPWKIEFLTSGDFEAYYVDSNVDIYTVGGGGSGANGGRDYYAGGGGGGYTNTVTNKSLTINSIYNVTVGLGGVVVNSTPIDGTAGGASSFGSLCRANGGKGGKMGVPGNYQGYGGEGGSGGGGGGACGGVNCVNGGKGGANGTSGFDAEGNTPEWGNMDLNNGGKGCSTNNLCKKDGATCTNTRDFCESSGTLRAGGGGGRAGLDLSVGAFSLPGEGGAGGGGKGADSKLSCVTPAKAGQNNYGGGGGAGGGAGACAKGATGGSGIVIIRKHQ